VPICVTCDLTVFHAKRNIGDQSYKADCPQSRARLFVNVSNTFSLSFSLSLSLSLSLLLSFTTRSITLNPFKTDYWLHHCPAHTRSPFSRHAFRPPEKFGLQFANRSSAEKVPTRETCEPDRRSRSVSSKISMSLSRLKLRTTFAYSESLACRSLVNNFHAIVRL